MGLWDANSGHHHACVEGTWPTELCPFVYFIYNLEASSSSLSLILKLIWLENSNLGSRTFKCLPSVLSCTWLLLSEDRNRERRMEDNKVIYFIPLIQFWVNVLMTVPAPPPLLSVLCYSWWGKKPFPFAHTALVGLYSASSSPASPPLAFPLQVLLNNGPFTSGLSFSRNKNLAGTLEPFYILYFCLPYLF